MTTDPSEGYAQALYFIQKVLHEKIDGDYPVSRFMVQIEMMNKDPEYKKIKTGNKSPKRFR